MIGKPMKQTGKWVSFLILVPVAAILIIGKSACTQKDPSEIELSNKSQSPAIEQISSYVEKSLKERIDSEIKDTYLKDFSMSLSPHSIQRYSIILKKDIVYDFYFLSNSSNDKFAASIESSKKEYSEFINFSYSRKLTYKAKETGAYHLSVENLSDKTADALIVLTLVALPEIPKMDPTKDKIVEVTDTLGDVFFVVEVMPTYNGGEAQTEFTKYISANMKYPVEAAKNKIQGKVYAQFIIEKDGSITNAKVIRSANPLLDLEALRIINASPKWEPGKQRGQAVRVSYTFPISFVL